MSERIETVEDVAARLVDAVRKVDLVEHGEAADYAVAGDILTAWAARREAELLAPFRELAEDCSENERYHEATARSMGDPALRGAAQLHASFAVTYRNVADRLRALLPSPGNKETP